ncbi:hypothetical protein ACHAW6_011614 [Cyclotella cf. meneghiniana]
MFRHAMLISLILLPQLFLTASSFHPLHGHGRLAFHYVENSAILPKATTDFLHYDAQSPWTTPRPVRPARNQNNRPTSLSSTLVDFPPPSFSPTLLDLHAIQLHMSLVPSLLSTSFTYLSLLLFHDRPRGFLSLPASTLSVSPSSIPHAGLGLFVTISLPCGTILGSYPGVLRDQVEFYNEKCIAYPNAVYYSWRLGSDGRYVLDPTDERGEIHSYCYGGIDVISCLLFRTILRFCAKSTELARINEPPLGYGGCNVVAREELDQKRVVFELCRDVVEGEELFMDYGVGYDRSGYVS